MKKRFGFVSNSSSSSFAVCLVGINVESFEKAEQSLQEKYKDQMHKYDSLCNLLWSYDETLDCLYDCSKDTDKTGFFIGKRISCMQDNITLGDFKKQSLKDLSNFFTKEFLEGLEANVYSITNVTFC